MGRTWAALADFTVAIHLDSDCWTYWYYRATTLNLNGHLEESIDDFRECMRLSNPAEHYPLIHWIYTTYVQLGKFDEAEKTLDLIDATVEPPQMDYGYCRAVRLYKGLVKPEEFVEPDMKDKVLPRENRVNLELNGMYYGLYCYWTPVSYTHLELVGAVLVQQHAVAGAHRVHQNDVRNVQQAVGVVQGLVGRQLGGPGRLRVEHALSLIHIYRVRAAGAQLCADPVTVNEAPQDSELDECRALGRALAAQ